MIRKLLLPSLAALLLAACAAKPALEPAILVHSVQPAYPPRRWKKRASKAVPSCGCVSTPGAA